MIKKIILFVILGFIIQFVGRLLYESGEWKSITPHGNTKCIRVKGFKGAEDVVLDYDTGYVYTGSEDRGHLLNKPANMTHKQMIKQTPSGQLIAINLNDNKLKPVFFKVGRFSC